MPTVFFAYRDAPERRAALAAPGALDRYRLFGLDEFRARGARVRHNLERDSPPPAWTRAAARGLNDLLRLLGGYGGDFATVLASLRTVNGTDVVFSTTDTVGIPLVLLKRAGLVRSPLVYAAIGLPERLVQLRGGPIRRLYANALRTAHTIVAYADGEVEWLRRWLGPDAPPVLFVPFGVDVEAFSPHPGQPVELDVVSVGADPRRDFELLTAVARRHPELGFHIVATSDRARSLGQVPANVAIEKDVSLERVRDRLDKARVIALPVCDNSYSGATTSLLQAMAMGKPVVVSRTDAIADGYDLENGGNCVLVPPGNAEAFDTALGELLANSNMADALGARARETVVARFSWQRYTDTLWEILSAASERP